MNTASQSDTPKTDSATQTGRDGVFHYHLEYVEAEFARSLERHNTELAKDKARLDRLENFYLNSDSDSWLRFLKEAATSGFRRVIDDAMLPQPAPKEQKL